MIASYNLADMRFARTDPRMADFFDNVDRMNALAERSPGFVWRLIEPKSDESRASQGPGTTLTTLSVWESPDALGDYVFNTIHVQFYLRRHEWFDLLDRQYFVMWPVQAADWPTEQEAISRLDHYQKHGSTDHAFGWDRVDTSRWTRKGQSRRCAHVA